MVTKGHPSLRLPFSAPHGGGNARPRSNASAEVPDRTFPEDDHQPPKTRITDAETSPDGEWVAMRTNRELLLYRRR